jgi:tRNA A22 N-methylase
MPFEQGHKKKGGRTKGIPNKTTKELRELLTEAIEGEIERIPEYFNDILCPKEKLDTLVKFLPFITPKIQSLKVVEEKPKIDEILIKVIDTGKD